MPTRLAAFASQQPAEAGGKEGGRQGAAGRSPEAREEARKIGGEGRGGGGEFETTMVVATLQSVLIGEDTCVSVAILFRGRRAVWKVPGGVFAGGEGLLGEDHGRLAGCLGEVDHLDQVDRQRGH